MSTSIITVEQPSLNPYFWHTHTPNPADAHTTTMGHSDRTTPLIVSSVAIVGIIWVMMVLAIRLYLRYKLNGPVGNDDYAAILATTLGVAQSAVVLVGVHSGLGSDRTLVDATNDQTTMKVSPA